ncbi:hypothetical protein [Halobellus sp. GM3]|uniref:hypothetical protein n=1 Tax=Halobellus sp. GM3 TaxID=3458410 RepID=UPI00403DAC0F
MSGAFLLSLPVLADLTQPLGLLSTTALVFLFLFAWYLVWVVVQVARHRAIRFR